MMKGWPPVGDCVMVLWEDITGNGGWTDPEDGDWSPALCSTIGWIQNDESENLYLLTAATLSDSGSVSDTCIIPIACVKQMWVLELGRPTTFR